MSPDFSPDNVRQMNNKYMWRNRDREMTRKREREKESRKYKRCQAKQHRRDASYSATEFLPIHTGILRVLIEKKKTIFFRPLIPVYDFSIFFAKKKNS